MGLCPDSCCVMRSSAGKFFQGAIEAAPNSSFMDIAVEFDQLSAGYTENITRWVPYYREMLESLAGRLPVGFSPRRVADLGCGNGNVTALLLQRFPEAAYILVDASAEMLEACGHRFAGKENVACRRAFFQELDFPAQSFDLVVAGLSLHHLQGPEKQEIFRKVFGWLAPGGCFSQSDLFVERGDEPGYGEVIGSWRRTAIAQGTTKEEWEWLMGHHAVFDYPNGYGQQMRWLREAGFSQVAVTWNSTAWGNVLAVKEKQDKE